MSVEGFEPKIVGLLCNWCSYAGADMAGTSRMTYPSNIKIIRLPCTGRVNPMIILKAFQQGADGVLVSGCHPGDCHYVDGNYYARRRLAMLEPYLDYLGIEKGRFKLEWVSASEGKKWKQVVETFTGQVKQLGPRKKIS